MKLVGIYFSIGDDFFIIFSYKNSHYGQDDSKPIACNLVLAVTTWPRDTPKNVKKA